MRLNSEIDRLTIQRLIDNDKLLRTKKENPIAIDFNRISNICEKNNVIVSLIYNNEFFSIGNKVHYLVSGKKYHFIITNFTIVNYTTEQKFSLIVGGHTLNDKDEVVSHSFNQCIIYSIYKSEIILKEYSII